MIKLLKKMGKREVLMAVLCTILVLGQVYFDLTLPDYMTDLTMMLNTAGSETSDILNVGLKMLGCTLASAALAIGCGYLSAKTASGFSYTVREKLFNHVMDMGSEEMQDFFHTEPYNKDNKRHHTDTDDSVNGTSDDNKISYHGSVGCYKDTWQELGAFSGDCGVRCGDMRIRSCSYGDLHTEIPAYRSEAN